MLPAGGAKFAGDFLVANLSEDETRLEMVLVDVCGKGVAAGTQSLQFAGALGGLIGALPPLGLFAAANDFLIRQDWDEGFATAVHVLIDLQTGDYSIINAGHPPALRWDSATSEWEIDGARGTALGIMKRPDFHQTTGRARRRRRADVLHRRRRRVADAGLHRGHRVAAHGRPPTIVIDRLRPGTPPHPQARSSRATTTGRC